MLHNSTIFIFDHRGRIRLYVNDEAGDDSIVHDIKILLGDN